MGFTGDLVVGASAGFGVKLLVTPRSRESSSWIELCSELAFVGDAGLGPDASAGFGVRLRGVPRSRDSDRLSMP